MLATSRTKSAKALFALIAPPNVADEATYEGLDWNWTIERASAHKVAALLAARLRASSLWTRLTPVQTTALEDASGRAEAVVGAAERTIQLLDQYLREEGIPFLVTKGIVLSRFVYPASNLRSFSDVDVVVAPQNVAAAVAVLHSHGYRQGQVRQTLGAVPSRRESQAARQTTRRFYERFEHEIPFTAPGGSGLLPIDLHWRIAPRRRLAIDAKALWDESRSVSLAGLEVGTLSPEATLIHLALHATTCSLAAFRLLHLCDVAWALHRSDYDPHRLQEVAGRWGARQHLHLVGEMAERLFDLPNAGGRPIGVSPRVTTDSFLLDEPPRSPAQRLWKEAVWGMAMGCLAHNMARSAAMRWTRAMWHGRRALDRMASGKVMSDER